MTGWVHLKKRPETTMLKNKYTGFILCSLLVLLSACSKNQLPYPIVTEEANLINCRYLDTISEVTDPGKIIFPAKFSNPYGGELNVMNRASVIGASHIAWIYNYPIGSSASAYRCDD